MSKGTVILLVVLGCLLLAVANVALWASLDVFNPGRFGERVAEGLQSEAASQALAGAIVARLIEYYPEFPAAAQGLAEEAAAWLLQRPVFAPVFKETAAVASAVMTTSAQDVVGIDLSDVGSELVGVVTAINPDAGANAQAALDAAHESGPLAIYESGRFPKLRGLSNTLPWIWPLAGLGAIALFVLAYLKAAAQKTALTTIGIGVLITGLLSLLLVPALQAPVQSSITDPTMQVVVGAVLSTLLRGLAIQCLILGLIGAVLMIASHTAHKEDGQAAASPAVPDQAPAAPAQPSATPDQAPAAPDQAPAAPDQPSA